MRNYRSLSRMHATLALRSNDIWSSNSRLTCGMLDTVSTFRRQRSGKCLFVTHGWKIFDIVTTSAVWNRRLSWYAYAFFICAQRKLARYTDFEDNRSRYSQLGSDTHSLLQQHCEAGKCPSVHRSSTRNIRAYRGYSFRLLHHQHPQLARPILVIQLLSAHRLSLYREEYPQR